MNILAHALCLSLAAASPVWAVAPSEAEEKTEIAETAWAPPWKHKLGVRFGTAAFSSGSIVGAASLFYESQHGPDMALRYALEISGGQERYKDTIPRSESTAVHRVGVAVDCIRYLSESRHDGTGLYGLAGLGVHRIHVSDGRWTAGGWSETNPIKIVPTLSIGAGYHFGRSFGMEYNYTLSALSTTFPESAGDWGQLTLNFRFPVPGMSKGNWRH